MKHIITLTLIILLFAAVNNVNAQACIAGTISAQRDTVCLGTRANLNVSGSSGTIQWQSSFDALNFIDIQGAYDTSNYWSDPLTQSTFYRVYVTNGSCSDTSLILQIIVPPAATAAFNFSVTGTVVTFNSSQSAGNIVAYYWDFGDGQISMQPNPVYNFSGGNTSYNVCLTIYDAGNCSSTFCRNVTTGNGGSTPPVNPCTISYFIIPDSIPHVWDLYYTPAGAQPITYAWAWGDGGTSVGDTGGHTYSGPGSYDICVTMRDDTGCIATYCDSSTYLFRMASDNSMIGVKSQSSAVLAGVKTIKPVGNGMSVYPNPCINCEIKGVDDLKDIVVTDIVGRHVNASFTKTAGGFLVNMPASRTGIFLVRNSRTGEVTKFIKE